MSIKELLGVLFKVEERNGKDFITFDPAVFDEKHQARKLYEAVSEAMHESGLSFDFSYEIASRAVDILTELENWNDEDAIAEAVDSSVPIYNHKLMQIYLGDWWAIDEAIEDLGNSSDSIGNAQHAWYMQIENMVEAIKSKIAKIA